jgi:glycosyltransferase involved in cell wall biosynthesis
VRIAHVTDCYLPRLGGIELQVHDLARRQAGAGHDVTVITSTAAPGIGLLDPGAVRVCRVGAGVKAGSIAYRRSFAVRGLVAAAGFDVVHVHASTWSPLAFLAADQAVQLGVPTVATVHSMWARSTVFYRAGDRLVRWSDRPIAWSAVSSAAAGAMQGILGDRARVSILPNGVDPARWRVGHIRGRPGETRLVAVTRLSPRKRPLQLARMLREARRRLPAGCGLSVEIVGDGPLRERLEGYLRRHDMTSWVQVRGRRSRAEIRSTLARSDLFIAPAVLESFGIAALEARCAGVPVLARSGTGVEDFVEHGRHGWIVGSDPAMVDAIVALAGAPEMLRRVAAASRSKTPAINWDRVLEGCDTLYAAAGARFGPAAPSSVARRAGDSDDAGPDRPGDRRPDPRTVAWGGPTVVDAG